MASGNTEDPQTKTTMEQRPSSQIKKKPLFGWVTLNPGIKQRSYFAALMHALVLGFFLSGVELLQQNLLVSPDYYNFTSDQAIQYNSAITFEDLLIKMIVTPLYGIMIDKIGRQKSAFIGYCTMTIALVLFPMKHYWPSTNFGWYFGARFIYSNGSAIIPIIPLIADYVDDHSKGRAIGFNVLFISIGFSLSTLVITLLNNYNLFYTCMVFAGVMFGLGNLYTLFLKPGNRYYRSKPIPDLETSQSNQIVDMNSSSRMGKRSLIKNDFKEKPWILAGLVFAFMNGTGLAITSQLLNLYVQSFGTPDGRALGSQTVFKANIASTVTSLVIGPMLDFIKPIYIAILAFVVTILGYCNVWAISDPTDLAMTFIAVGVGIGYSATQLLTNYLGFKNYRRSIRGMLFALANTVIVFGVICVSVIGGNLFRYFNRNWPFYIAGGCCVIGLIVFLYIYFNKILPKENGRNGDQQSPLLRNLSSEGYKDSESFSYKEEEEEDSQRQE